MTLKRQVGFLLIMVLLLSFIFGSFASAALVTINNIPDKIAGDTVTLSGTNSLGTISIKVIKPDTTVLYINTVSEKSYSDTFTIPSDAPIGKYTVVAGQGTTVAITEFNVNSSTLPSTGVTGVTLSPTTLNLAAGTTGTLTATVVPANAANKTVSYASSKPSVATVNSITGAVTAVAAGTATITVTTAEGNKTAACTVTVTASGGGTGMGTPTPTPTPTPDQTSGADNGSITIDIKSDANGLVDARIKDSAMDAAISGAKAKTVNIQLKADANAKNISVSISGQQFKKAIDKNIEKVSINTGFATITVATELIKQNMKNESDVLKLNINKIDNSKLSQEVKDIINQSTVYDFTMMIGTKTISNFENVGQVAVRIKYDLKSGENAEKVILYYLNDNGKPEIVMNARYDEKTGNITFMPKHFSKYAAVHSKVTFSDIEKPTWAKIKIEALAARGIVAGVGDNTFNPYGNVTRAQFIQMLIKAFELNDSSASTTFNDVKAGDWYYNSIATAQKLGIVSGKKDGNFGVTDQISRQDMAVMLYKTAKLAKVNLESKSVNQFTDKDKISGYAIEAVEAMQEAGIVSGVGDGMFAPMNKSTRAEASTIIYNLFSAVR